MVIMVKGTTPMQRAALDRFEVDYDDRWHCNCDWSFDGNGVTLLGLVDQAMTHVTSGECTWKIERDL